MAGEGVFFEQCQKKFVILALTVLLELSVNTSVVIDSLTRFTSEIMATDTEEFDKSLLEEVKMFWYLVSPLQKACVGEAVHDTKVSDCVCKALHLVPKTLDKASSERQHLVVCLRRFGVVGPAKSTLQGFEKSCEF